MCLIAWKWQPGEETPLLLLANRDEYYQRAALPVHWWEGNQVLAGQDLQAGGTWLGVSRSGRLAALTNYRQFPLSPQARPSRGALVLEFLQGQDSALDYLTLVQAQSAQYNPFNLLVFDGHHLMGLESRHARILSMPHGMGAVSNADFHSPWPKLSRLREHLEQAARRGETSHAHLWPLLQHRAAAPDAQLPQTGIPLELERALSSTFIALPDYGTRASSIIHLGSRQIMFAEQSYTAQGPAGQVSWQFEIERPMA